jgi:DNA invertase Pin-like site-specific DNA recombinase
VKIVSYLRVSTGAQERSGLGLNAQRAAVAAYAKNNAAEIVQEFVEIESGRRVDRPQLRSAIALSRRLGARLCVAKLDRLARNAAFLCGLVDSGLDWVAADNPTITPMVAKILAVVAEEEARLISVRTRDALAIAKARGVLLGAASHRCRRLSAGAMVAGRASSARVRTAAARDAYADVEPIVKQLRNDGRSLAEIAAELNAKGIRSRTGKPICKVKVKRILDRLAV